MPLGKLDEIESRSLHVIREAYRHFPRLGLLWSIGKDSTTLLWLCRKAFFGRLPFPVVHIDTTRKFPEIYEFRDRYVAEWGLKLIVARNDRALAEGVGPEKSKFRCCTALKTEALKQAIAREGFAALLLGIRRDEHGIRAKERYISPRDEDFRWDYRNQPAELWDQYKNRFSAGRHARVHPLLHWTELDVWMYVRREGIPVCPLYFARAGRRYRSIGCQTCCQPMESSADNIDAIVAELLTTDQSERAGRAQDKERAYMMQRLRALGYM